MIRENNFTVNVTFSVRGAEYVTPKCATLACGLFWAEGNQDPADLENNSNNNNNKPFTSPLTT